MTVPRKIIEETRLDRMLEAGVISRVDQPADWCAPIVGTPKWNGKVRVFLNLSKLNEFNRFLVSVDKIQSLANKMQHNTEPKLFSPKTKPFV